MAGTAQRSFQTLFALGLLLLTSSAAQAKTIRVLLHDDQTNLSVRCPNPLSLSSLDGKKIGLPAMSQQVNIGLRKGGGLIAGMAPVSQGVFATCQGGHPIQVGSSRWRGKVLFLESSGKLLAINYVNLEDYLLSVVPSEMPTQWPMEALKAQSIAARSYVLNSIGQYPGMPYDVMRSVEDQVYLGLSQENPRSTQAVKATAGQVMLFNGKFVRAFFHSTSGGITGESTAIWHENLPYIRPVLSPNEQSKHNNWRVEITHDDLEKALLEMGIQVRNLKAILPVGKDASGRHMSFALVDQYGVRTLSAFDFRKAVGRSTVKSTLFDLIYVGREGRKISEKALRPYLYGQTALEDVKRYIMVGKGWGHGAGMSQFGALAMSEKGRNYQQILKHYYTGIDIATLAQMGLD